MRARLVVLMLLCYNSVLLAQEDNHADSIITEVTKYIVLRQKAKQGSLDPTAFHKWIHIAQNQNDPGLDSIVTAYVSDHQALLEDKEMLIIILNHLPEQTETQLKYLYQNKHEIARITERTLLDLETTLLKKLIAFAVVKTSINNQVDFDAYGRFVALYIPDRAALETQKLKIKYWAYINEYGKSLDELAICINNDKIDLPPMELSRLLIEYAPLINSLNQTEKFVQYVKRFSISPGRSKEWYCSDLALLALYIAENEDKQMVNRIAEKLKSDDQVPVLIKLMSDKLFTTRYK